MSGVEAAAWAGCDKKSGKVHLAKVHKEHAEYASLGTLDIQPLYSQATVDTLRAQLEAAQTSLDRLTGMKFSDRMHAALVDRAEAAEAECAAMRERMRFLATDGCVEGFTNVAGDIYDYACDSAEEHGRDEPNDDDLANGLCRLVDAARTKEETK